METLRYKYQGSIKDGYIYEGSGVYTYDNGMTYSGAFEGGLFHGKGEMILPNSRGKIQGTWENGKLKDGKVIFSDGLTFQGSLDDNYCKEEDRMIYPENEESIVSTEASSYLHPDIPVGTFDAGNGYFDPKTQSIHDYETHQVLRKPDAHEQEWLESTARFRAP